MFLLEAAWLCLVGAAVLGSWVLCRRKGPGPLQSQAVCLAAVWVGACLLNLSFLWSLVLCASSGFLLHTCRSDEESLPVDGKAVLVTGTDTGFGHGLAKHLDKLGFTVFAGVLDERSPGAEELRRSCSRRLSVLQMDVTKPEQIQDAYSKVVEKIQDKGLWAVVNNAGIIGFPIDGELIPMNDYKRCMAVNFFGPVEVTKTFLPLLRKSKGRLVMISSMGGSVPLLRMAAYNSTKAALTMFSSVLRQELSKWGVKVIVIQPGGFRTNISGTSDVWDKMEKNILENLPREVQEDYGQDYILKQRNFLQAMTTRTASDLTPVLQDVQHAISARSPSPFYAPGKLAYLWVCFASVSPTSLLDYVIKKLFTIGQDMPRALSMSS
ncbi:17-beta-hydroxysteroid dehydrogenase type 2 [Perognathus longimembris pacificus]|uniref:17-beta-hydroxysteroid dehydrogenase type 2 n=1 Tax=Perognathus longimembris pacificus TaxID=214514 RepID=UPI00201950E6|nr:17-beta-hydroxysteroid dehydrogenase type 2 [Perognathus longimembris pacificus]